MASLFEIRSATADAAIKWLHGMADALDETGLYFDKQPILGSATAVDAFVYTKRRKPDAPDGARRDAERPDRERSLIDETVAHLYEQPRDWEEREKKRWRQAIQPSRVRIGVRGSPGSGKTFLTRNSAVALARESARNVEERLVHLYDVSVPFWITAGALAFASGSDAAALVVDACLLSMKQTGTDLPLPPCDWILRAAASPRALIFVDALDQLAGGEVEGFKRASRRLKDLPGRLIVTCRTMHCDERVSWLGWSGVVEVELAPFERREQREFERNFPPGVGAPGLAQLLAANYPLRQACSSPLLLAFVCLLLAEGENLTGGNRVTVYIKTIRRLLSGGWRNVTPKWKGNKLLQGKVLKFLEEAAWEFFHRAPETNRFTLARWEQAGPEPVADLLAELDKCGLVVAAGENDLGDDCWSFLHRTLLEFLAGRALARQPEAVWLEEAKKHFWYEPEWIEVFTFLSAHVKDATPLIEALEQEEEDIFQSILYLKVRLATTARQIAPGTLDEIASSVILLSREAAETNRYPSAYVLAMIQLAGGTALGQRISGGLPLRYPHVEFGYHAAQALALLADVRAFDACAGLLADTHAGVRAAAAHILGQLEDSRAVHLLVALARDEDPWIREVAAHALGQLGDMSVCGTLAKLLEDTEPTVRSSATRALGELGATSVLVELFSHQDTEIRLTAALSVMQLGDPRAIDALASLLQDADLLISLPAAVWLGQLGDIRAVDTLVRTLGCAHRLLQLPAAYGLAELGDARGFRLLAGVLQDGDELFCGLAAESLWLLGDPGGVDALITLLQDERAGVRAQVAAALGRLGDTRAVAPLVGLLLDEDISVRTSAAFSLARLGDTRAANVLVRLLQKTRGGTRKTVMDMLHRLAVLDRAIRLPLRLIYEDLPGAANE